MLPYQEKMWCLQDGTEVFASEVNCFFLQNCHCYFETKVSAGWYQGEEHRQGARRSSTDPRLEVVLDIFFFNSPKQGPAEPFPNTCAAVCTKEGRAG